MNFQNKFTFTYQKTLLHTFLSLVFKVVENLQCILKDQKEPSRGVLQKRCSENMQQIYRRTAIPKCDFKKVAKATLFKSHFGMGVLL